MGRFEFFMGRFGFGHGALAKVTCSVFIFPCGVSISVMEHFHFAAPEPEKPKGPTEADVQRLADEIKSLARPPTMTEARDLAKRIFGRFHGRPVFELLKADWERYGLEVVKGDSLAQKLICPLKKVWQNTSEQRVA